MIYTRRRKRPEFLPRGAHSRRTQRSLYAEVLTARSNSALRHLKKATFKSSVHHQSGCGGKHLLGNGQFCHISDRIWCKSFVANTFQTIFRRNRIVSDGAQTLWASRCMLQKNAHEISSPEVPMVKSYDALKSGYLYGENVKNQFSTINSGCFLTSCADMVCHKVKELTRTFQDHVVRPCGSSMVLRYDGCHVKKQLFAHLFGQKSGPANICLRNHCFLFAQNKYLFRANICHRNHSIESPCFPMWFHCVVRYYTYLRRVLDFVRSFPLKGHNQRFNKTVSP